ncbi:FAD binding domain [Lecanosticta acicola]|uniref:FAD binding domain n=1 Tax=Lecanosticta acicola TaxID=111012 RepID=A0AAI8Z464_9PEZI|nr:FAD binding domain [Lecanosticta acicola]
MAPFFTNMSCDPFTPRSAQCIIGTYVQYAVNASSATEYQNALSFATSRNIRLAIRNTGHDFLGKSTGAGALAIWTHNIKEISVTDYRSAAYSGKAMKIGAGNQFFEVYPAANAAGVVVVGGTCPSVGMAGGYTQGAGHGLLVSKYGFSADQTLAWEVVLVNGTLVTATPSQNSDLYWALSGGGGGSYGVVLSLTVKAYPDQPTAGANLTFAASQNVSRDLFYQGVERFLAQLPAILDSGASSIWSITNASFTLAPTAAIGQTKEQIDALHQPVVDALTQLKIPHTYFSANYPTYLEMLNAMDTGYETAMYSIGSRLIPRDVIVGQTRNLTQAINKIESYHTQILGSSFNGTHTPTSPNSLNAGYRDATMSLSIGTLYDDNNRTANVESNNLMTNTLVPALSSLIPGGGNAYVNEGDPFEPKFQKVFWGENYDRLLRIKNAYDPNSFLWAQAAVGSEAWTLQSDGRLCRSH